MTDALEFYIKDWERIIWDATGDQTKVDRMMELARLNGMFDPVKMIPAPQALAATPAASSRIERAKAIREEQQCSLQEAVRLERAEFLTAEIQSRIQHRRFEDDPAFNREL